MSDGSICTQETIYKMFYIWSSIFIICELAISVICIRRLLRELKEPYLDIFKILQCTSSIISYIVVLIIRFYMIFDKDQMLILVILYRLNLVNYYHFHISNKLWWFTMIVHLLYYKKIRSGIRYKSFAHKI